MTARHPYRRGEVVLVQFPFSTSTGRKDRPAVVLSTDVYHDQWDELLVVALTTKAPKSPRPTDHLLQDWQAAGLQHPSWMRSHLATVHRLLILRKLGDLSPRDLLALEDRLRAALGL
jgi:mRNA-degrading endonuclease toxin of MazEF toxin-antitoxin module